MHSMALDWDDLRYLRAALKGGSLSAAARELRVEHTTIGRRLAALERAFGAPLVLRGPSGLAPTRLAGKLMPLLDDVARSVAAAEKLVATESRHVRLAVPSGLASVFSAGLDRLRHEGVSLELVSGARPVDLAKGEADVAIRVGGAARDPELIVRKLGEAGWALYASGAYLARHGAPKDLDQLGGHDVVGYDASLAGVPGAKWLAAREETANVVMRSREMTDMVAAAVSGLGLAVLTCILGDAEPALKRLSPDPVARTDIVLLYRREVARSEAIRAVVRLATEVMREHAQRLTSVR